MLINISSRGIGECPDMIIFKTFAGQYWFIVLICPSLMTCEVQFLFIYLLRLHFSGMALYRGVWLEEKPHSGNTLEAAERCLGQSLSTMLPWMGTLSSRKLVCSGDTALQLTFLCPPFRGRLLQPVPAPRGHLHNRESPAAPAGIISSLRRIKVLFNIPQRENCFRDLANRRHPRSEDPSTEGGEPLFHFPLGAKPETRLVLKFSIPSHPVEGNWDHHVVSAGF